VADKEAEGGAAMDAVISYQIMAISWTEPTSAVKTPGEFHFSISSTKIKKIL